MAKVVYTLNKNCSPHDPNDKEIFQHGEWYLCEDDNTAVKESARSAFYTDNSHIVIRNARTELLVLNRAILFKLEVVNEGK